MIDNNTEIRFNSIVKELQAQRDILGDRAANLAAELAVLQAENEMLKGRIRNLEGDTNGKSERSAPGDASGAVATESGT